LSKTNPTPPPQGVFTFNKNTAINFMYLSNANLVPITGTTGKIGCGSGQIDVTVKGKKSLLEGEVCALC